MQVLHVAQSGARALARGSRATTGAAAARWLSGGRKGGGCGASSPAVVGRRAALTVASAGGRGLATAAGPARPLAGRPGLAPHRAAGLAGTSPALSRGLRTSSHVAHGLKAGIVGLPNVGKVRRGLERVCVV